MSRRYKIAMVVGAVAGLLCHLLPVEYHGACGALVDALSLTCGG
jgi:hypothetical protein